MSLFLLQSNNLYQEKKKYIYIYIYKRFDELKRAMYCLLTRGIFDIKFHLYFEQKIVWNSIQNGTYEIKTRFQLHQFSLKKILKNIFMKKISINEVTKANIKEKTNLEVEVFPTIGIRTHNKNQVAFDGSWWGWRSSRKRWSGWYYEL